MMIIRHPIKLLKLIMECIFVDRLKKVWLAMVQRGLIQRICNDYGNMASADFIDNLQSIVTEYMKSHAYSVGISDLNCE